MRTKQNNPSGFFQNIGPWYLVRLRLFPYWLADRAGFNIFIHLFLQSDDDVPHDHPWDNWSVLLWGKVSELRQVPFHDGGINNGYAEWHTANVPLWTRKFREAEYRHSVQLHSKFALTIFIPLQKRRSWYFYPEGKAVPWRTFLGLD